MNLTTADQKVDRKIRGARATAAAREITSTSQASSGFKEPWDVLYKKSEEAPPPQITRVKTEKGTIVRFPDDWKKGNGQASKRTTIASDVSTAPRFVLGNYSPSADLPDTLASLPGHRHGSK